MLGRSRANSAVSTWIVTAGTQQIRFNLTSFSVPEPSTVTLVGLGRLLAGYTGRR
jgi:hypothetical protein